MRRTFKLEFYKMDMLRILIIIFLLIIVINLMSCFKIKKNLWSVCPQSQYRIRTFFDITINDCAKECLNRPLCKALGHRRYMNVCELYSTEVTEDDKTCITVRKRDIAEEQGEVPCKCQDGETCDPATKKCVHNECQAFSNLDHGKVLGNMYHISARLMFKCDLGWVEKSLQSSMTCLQDGSWSYSPACVVINQPIDGQWSSWQAWQGCSVTCGDGVRRRNRACDNPKPDSSGKLCAGEAFEQEVCTGNGTCPVACPAYSDSFHLNCTHLFVTSTNVTYSKAQELCRDKQGQLARVDSGGIKTFVAQHLNGQELWINGQKTEDGVFKYLDGTKITVSFWIEDEPNGTGKCLRVVDGGGWRDTDCNKQYGYICKKVGQIVAVP